MGNINLNHKMLKNIFVAFFVCFTLTNGRGISHGTDSMFGYPLFSNGYKNGYINTSNRPSLNKLFKPEGNLELQCDH